MHCYEEKDWVEVAPSQICIGEIYHITNTCMCWVINIFNEWIGKNYVDSNSLEQPFWCNPLRDQEPLPNPYANPELSVPLPNDLHHWLCERTRLTATSNHSKGNRGAPLSLQAYM